MVKKEIEIIPEQQFDRAVEKEDVILVFKSNRSFLICDKEYGIKYNKGFYRVLRVIGGGKGYGNSNTQR